MRRRREPNAGKINVVGGKLEAGETPGECVRREVREETGITPSVVRFSGIVTWNTDTVSYAKHRALGMYMYVAEFPGDLDPGRFETDTPEGRLAWWNVSDVLSGGTDFVDNVRFFLRPMLDGEEPAEYYCQYHDGRLTSVTRLPLGADLRELARP